MEKNVRKETESQEKRPYVEPKLEKAQKIEDVTRGVPIIIT